MQVLVLVLVLVLVADRREGGRLRVKRSRLGRISVGVSGPFSVDDSGGRGLAGLGHGGQKRGKCRRGTCSMCGMRGRCGRCASCKRLLGAWLPWLAWAAIFWVEGDILGVARLMVRSVHSGKGCNCEGGRGPCSRTRTKPSARPSVPRLRPRRRRWLAVPLQQAYTEHCERVAHVRETERRQLGGRVVLAVGLQRK